MKNLTESVTLGVPVGKATPRPPETAEDTGGSIVLTEESAKKVLELVETEQTPTPAMRELMEGAADIESAPAVKRAKR